MGDWIQLFTILKYEGPEVVYTPRSICIYDADGVSNQQADLRAQQRSTFLKTQYSSWELRDLTPIARLRGRSYYTWVLTSLDRWRRQVMLQWISKYF